MISKLLKVGQRLRDISTAMKYIVLNQRGSRVTLKGLPTKCHWKEDPGRRMAEEGSTTEFLLLVTFHGPCSVGVGPPSTKRGSVRVRDSYLRENLHLQ